MRFLPREASHSDIPARRFETASSFLYTEKAKRKECRPLHSSKSDVEKQFDKLMPGRFFPSPAK
jgi:hypothetical protein